MAENYDLIFGQSASQQYAWSDSDYQNGWQTVGSTPPTAEQFDALQRKSDTKSQELNNRLTPLETKSGEDMRQASTAYSAGNMQTTVGLKYGWYLECIVGGITSASALSVPDPLIENDTIVDGTVTWKIKKISSADGVPLGTIIPYPSNSATLPSGYLECDGSAVSRTMYPDLFTLIGTTYGAGDGSTTFNLPDLTEAAILNIRSKTTITTVGTGTFTPPRNGVYKITLQGGGGGGACASYANSTNFGGSGGAQGGYLEFYEPLEAGTSYSYVIGAGGAPAAAGAETSRGSDGGTSSITIGDNVYQCAGGGGGTPGSYLSNGPIGGDASVNNVVVGRGAPGICGTHMSGGPGGGPGGGGMPYTDGVFGAGGAGGNFVTGYPAGGAGGDGYIIFEYIGTTMPHLIKAFDGQTADSALIDVTQYANALNSKVNRNFDNVVHHREMYQTSGSFTAPATGMYKITLQGGGGGGAVGNSSYTGGGGGAGGLYDFYEMLEAGTSYSYIIGAGGNGSSTGVGDAGGASSISVNGNNYVCAGGAGGGSNYNHFAGGGGAVTVNNVKVSKGFDGTSGMRFISGTVIYGGNGGGNGGSSGNAGTNNPAEYGGGGSGGPCNDGTAGRGANGGDGYIQFEWYSAS